MTTVRQALQQYLDHNGFTTASYTEPTVDIPIGPFHIPLPNTAGRKAVVPWHDLHHLATGYGTDFTGEAEVGIWELRAGCTNIAAYVYNLMAVSGGLVISPLRTYRAFRDARGTSTLYRLNLDYETTLDLELSAMRAMMGVPQDGLAKVPAERHAAAPSAQRA